MANTTLDNLKSLDFWKAVIAEALATMVLVLLGCGSVIATQDTNGRNIRDDVVQISLCFGLVVASMVWCISHISGGHLNPAVTIAFMITRRISIFKAVCYVVAQSGGAALGAYVLSLVAIETSSLGLTQPHRTFEDAQVFGIESLITFALVFTVFATCDTGREDLEGSGALAIGLSVTLCHLFAVPFTGSSMNPARSFGPALVKGDWNAHWLYWLGPLTGAVVASVLYENFFAVQADLQRFRNTCLRAGSSESRQVNDSKEQAKAEELRVQDTVTQQDRAEGHHVGKLPTPRWNRDRQVAIGTGLTPNTSFLAIPQGSGRQCHSPKVTEASNSIGGLTTSCESFVIFVGTSKNNS